MQNARWTVKTCRVKEAWKQKESKPTRSQGKGSHCACQLQAMQARRVGGLAGWQVLGRRTSGAAEVLALALLARSCHGLAIAWPCNCHCMVQIDFGHGANQLGLSPLACDPHCNVARIVLCTMYCHSRRPGSQKERAEREKPANLELMSRDSNCQTVISFLSSRRSLPTAVHNIHPSSTRRSIVGAFIMSVTRWLECFLSTSS